MRKVLTFLLLTSFWFAASGQPTDHEDAEIELALRTLIQEFGKGFDVLTLVEKNELSAAALRAAMRIGPTVRTKDIRLTPGKRFPPGFLILSAIDRTPDGIYFKLAFSPKTDGNMDCGLGVETTYKPTGNGQWKRVKAQLTIC